MKVIYNRTDVRKVKKIAKDIFGFVGEVLEVEPGVLSLLTPTRSLRVYPCGAIRYFDESLSGPHLTQPSLPTYEQAKAIADNFLEKIKEQGIMPKNQHIQSTFIWVGPGSEGIRMRKGENGIEVIEKVVNYLSVSFSLMYKGSELWGPEAKVNIAIGENGEIAEFTGFWKEIVEDGTCTIVPPAEALQKLTYNDLGIKLGKSSQRVTIHHIALGYFVRSVVCEEDYLQPAYLLGITLDEDNNMIRTAISATDKSLLYGVVKPAVSVLPSYQGGPPGATLVYTVGVANVGDLEDTFGLRVECDKNWVSTLGVTSVVVSARRRVEVSLNVAIPKDASSGEWAQIIVVVASRMNPEASSSGMCIARAEAILENHRLTKRSN